MTNANDIIKNQVVAEGKKYFVFNKPEILVGITN